MPDGEDDFPDHDHWIWTVETREGGWTESRCTVCGKLLDRWKDPKDMPYDPSEDEGPA